MTDFNEALEPRYTRRLSDLITAAFYEACRAGSLDAAAQLVLALECEVTRSTNLPLAEQREDGDDVDAVHARLNREVTRLHAIETSNDGDVEVLALIKRVSRDRSDPSDAAAG